MSALIDDISRVIASPVSRREAFRLVSGAVGGAVLASLGLARAARALGAQATTNSPNSPCPNHGVLCGGKCYPKDYRCCGTLVCNGDQICCSNTHCCDDAQTCCGTTPGSTCCNNTCCPPHQACCNGKCCTSPGAICCGGTCCSEGNLCCGGKCVQKRPSPSTVCIPV
jgi:hypothetical protein